MVKNHPKILVVDDEPDVTAYFQKFFGRKGFFVNTTASGKDALGMIKASKPDLVFLDLTLAEMTGRQVLQALRKFDRETKVIVITGHTLNSEAESEEFRALGISAYLNKPLSLDEVDKMAKMILGDNYPLAQFDQNIPTQEIKQALSTATHKLRNLLGNIKGECQVYLIHKKSGKYKNKSKDDVQKMSDVIIEDVVVTINKVMEVLNGVKSEK